MNNSKMETGIPDIFSNSSTVTAKGLDQAPAEEQFSAAHYRYDLPQELIAQEPLPDRASARCLIVDTASEVASGEVVHLEDKHFTDICDYFNAGDVLVLNNTKVIPARAFAYKKGTQADEESTVEILFVQYQGGSTWKAMISKQVEAGTILVLNGADDAEVTIKSCDDEGEVFLDFNSSTGWDILDKIGETPLPPYIQGRGHSEAYISEMYNTVYAKERTSCAAPTAGLHFTPELLQALKDKGVKIREVTLDVGLGTFKPVVVKDLRNHAMHTEHCFCPANVIKDIKEARLNHHNVVAVGTTSLRTLASIPEEVWENPTDFSTDTNIFIYPGSESAKRVGCIDGLITNFHAPETTLMMLVSVVAGYDQIMAAYKHAVQKRYRFMSFGDGMLIKRTSWSEAGEAQAEEA
jgi:S-adenosylmethionine:tRNA ribosyltransferase-isomerase